MSEAVENVSEKNSAQSKEVAAAPTDTIEDITTNNVEDSVIAVPEAVETVSSATTGNLDDADLKASTKESSTSPKVDNKKTPVKRTPSKRMSYIERAQKESEELVKNMGGTLEIEGGRRTRSSTRGTPTRVVAASTPPPAKKARTSPASGASTPTRPRGRGRKIDTAEDGGEEEETKATPSKKKTPAKGKRSAAKEVADEEEEEDEQEESKREEKKPEENQEKVDSPESNAVADEANATPEEDKTDAVLEPVVEETQSQVSAETLPTSQENVTNKSEKTSAPVEQILEVTKPAKNDNPMETGEAKPVENVGIAKQEAKPKVIATAPVEEVKEPTPEPMEVDSSSKSNDAIEKMEDDDAEVIEQPPVVKTSTNVVENQLSTSETKNTNEVNNVEKVEKEVKENSVAPSDVAAPPANIVANNSIAETAAATGVANANKNNTQVKTPAANDLNKTENDLCEPKIATSPPISAANNNSSVTTPQTCN